MIVRISGEGQYRLPDDERPRLNELELAVVATVESDREEDFPAAFEALLEFVRTGGAPVPDDELETSDVILPPADLSFAEAGKEFTGEGLIPD
ncbi:MAG: PspA-associated protein PspAA [Solirubrobacteraceae bacterium]